MKRIYKRPSHRRFIIREQLATYGRAIAQDIPYQEKYLKFMLIERNCEPLTAEKNLRIMDEFVSFLKKNMK